MIKKKYSFGTALLCSATLFSAVDSFAERVIDKDFNAQEVYTFFKPGVIRDVWKQNIPIRAYIGAKKGVNVPAVLTLRSTKNVKFHDIFHDRHIYFLASDENAALVFDSKSSKLSKSSALTYFLANELGGQVVQDATNDTPRTDLRDSSGVIILNADNNKSLIIDTVEKSSPLPFNSLGHHYDSRLKTLKFTGNADITVNVSIYSKEILLNNSSNITLTKEVNLGKEPTITLKKDANIILTQDTTMTANSPMLDLALNRLHFSGKGEINIDGDKTHIIIKCDNMKCGKVIFDKQLKFDLDTFIKQKPKITIEEFDINDITLDNTRSIISATDSSPTIDAKHAGLHANTDSKSEISVNNKNRLLDYKLLFDKVLRELKLRITANPQNVSDAANKSNVNRDADDILRNTITHAKDGDKQYTKLLSDIASTNDLKDGLERLVPNSTNNAITVSQVLDQSNHELGLRLASNVRSALRTASSNDYIISGISAGDSIDFVSQDPTKYGVWANPFYGVTYHKKRDTIPKYRSNMYGMTMGLDGLIDEQMLVGTAITYSRARHNHQGSKEDDVTKIESWVVSLYTYKRFGSNFFTGSIGCSHNNIKHSEKRIIKLNTDIAKSDYDIASYNVNLELGHDYQINDMTRITPIVGLGHYIIPKSHYTESGSDSTNLAISSKLTKIAELSAGAQLSFRKAFDNNLTIIPKIHGYISYDMHNNPGTVIARLKNNNRILLTKKPKHERLYYNLGGEFNVHDRFYNIEYGVEYDCELTTHYTNHVGALKLRVKF